MTNVFHKTQMLQNRKKNARFYQWNQQSLQLNSASILARVHISNSNTRSSPLGMLSYTAAIRAINTFINKSFCEKS